MDRSPAGLALIDELVAGWEPMKERVQRWRATSEAFFVFYLEQWDGGRAGSVTAQDVDGLLTDVLPDLFLRFLMPPATPGFAVAARDAAAIWSVIERLRAGASTYRH